MRSWKAPIACSIVILTALTAYLAYGGRTQPEADKAGEQPISRVSDDRYPTVVDFTLRSLDGGDIGLLDTVRKNRVTIVNFFATWCPPCRAETPDFVRFYKAYKGKGVEYLSIDIREKDSTVRRFAKEFGMTNPILMDSGGTVSDRYGVYSIPSTMIVDSKGQVLDSFTGLTSYETLKESVNKALKGGNKG